MHDRRSKGSRYCGQREGNEICMICSIEDILEKSPMNRRWCPKESVTKCIADYRKCQQRKEYFNWPSNNTLHWHNTNHPTKISHQGEQKREVTPSYQHFLPKMLSTYMLIRWNCWSWLFWLIYLGVGWLLIDLVWTWLTSNKWFNSVSHLLSSSRLAQARSYNIYVRATKEAEIHMLFCNPLQTSIF